MKVMILLEKIETNLIVETCQTQVCQRYSTKTFSNRWEGLL